VNYPGRILNRLNFQSCTVAVSREKVRVFK
jgi:hypothetical protein